MAIIESLRDGLKVLEIIATESKPVTIAWLVMRCSPSSYGDRHHSVQPGAGENGVSPHPLAPELSEASVRNAVETLVADGWLRKCPGERNSFAYGLGEKAARLWPIFLGRKLGLIEEQQAETAAAIAATRRLIEDF